MKARAFFLLILFLLIFFEATITSVPLSIISLLFLLVFTRSLLLVLTLAFILGIILDAVFVRAFFERSLFFVLFLLAIFLYERKFEIKTLPFILLASFIGSISYLTFFSYSDKLIQAFTAAAIAALVFIVFQKIIITHERRN